jgi:small-conductance mechanosensitive channel
MLIRSVLAALLCFGLRAQEVGAPVTIDGVEVLRVFGPLGSFNNEERAAAIRERILVLARKGFTGKLDVRDIPSENATAVVAGPAIVMAVLEKDAAHTGVTRAELAQKYAASIERAIETYRVQHTWSSFAVAAVKALVAWALFWLTAWAFWRAVRWIDVRSQAIASRRAAARGERGAQHFLWERGRVLLISVVKLAAAIFLLSEFSFVLSFTFGLFPHTAGISTTLLDYLSAAFGRVGMAIVHYLPSGAFVVIVSVLTRYILRAMKFWADALERGDLTIKALHPEMARPTYQLLRFLVIMFALVVAFPYLPGGNSEAFKGVSIFLGVVLSLGSSSAVSNVLAGLVLTYMRAFRVGDRVKIADTIGDVLERTLLVTRVRTIKNVEVVIPNGGILGSQVLNYSAMARTTGLILHTSVTIGYDSPWRKVHELLIRAAANTEGVLPAPPPFVLETSLNDFHITYELNIYTDQPNEIQNIYSRLHQAIQDSFNQGGIEIMSPTFYALRDGNTVTIPAADRPADYEAPSFRVRDTTNPQPMELARGRVRGTGSLG